ncbi:MAG: hypothetical protein RRZ38_00240 [Hafnia sp.]
MWPIDKSEIESRRNHVASEIKKANVLDSLNDKQINALLDHFFGSYSNGYEPSSDMKIVWRDDPFVKTTAIQRMNYLWVWPLYFLFIAPVKFIFTGETGTSKDSFFGRILKFLIGNY